MCMLCAFRREDITSALLQPLSQCSTWDEVAILIVAQEQGVLHGVVEGLWALLCRPCAWPLQGSMQDLMEGIFKANECK